MISFIAEYLCCRQTSQTGTSQSKSKAEEHHRGGAGAGEHAGRSPPQALLVALQPGPLPPRPRVRLPQRGSSHRSETLSWAPCWVPCWALRTLRAKGKSSDSFHLGGRGAVDRQPCCEPRLPVRERVQRSLSGTGDSVLKAPCLSYIDATNKSTGLI